MELKQLQDEVQVCLPYMVFALYGVCLIWYLPYMVFALYGIHNILGIITHRPVSGEDLPSQNKNHTNTSLW